MKNTISEQITKIRDEFPIFKNKGLQSPFVYFDHAATSLKPACVVDAIMDYYTKYTANIHRGVHRDGYEVSKMYEAVRKKIAQFLNAKKAKEVIFTPGTTASINLFARSFCQGFLKNGDRILLTQMEHHASIVCWQAMAKEFSLELDYIPITPQGELDLYALDELLTPKTKLISILAVSNTLGTINPISLISKKCHEKGIYIFVDAAQSISHFPTDVEKDDIDFLAFSGHKIFGPTGVGIFWGKEVLLKKMPPFFYGGGMIREVHLDQSHYLELPHCFEAGTPPIAEILGLGAAIDFVQRIGWPTLYDIEQYHIEQAQKIFDKYSDHVRILGPRSSRIDIFSFDIKGLHSHDIGSFMAEMGIAMRNGHQCTQPIIDFFCVSSVSRISSAIYNSDEDWQYLDEKIEEMLRFFHVK
ncbi:MAG: aminotransferase class V-fold PLP-dependent enzyme [Spirochaetia bacterium]